MYIGQTNSTNDWLKLHPDVDAVWTTWQTAGRGQAGNSWESEQGKNMLMSIRLKQPQVPVAFQFRLTMAVSLAVRDVVAKHLPENVVTIKWPNDIYVCDKKICGILIETTIVKDQIAEAVVGIGLNVNQTVWLSDAPNPVSIQLLSGTACDLASIYEELIEAIGKQIALLHQPEVLKNSYLAHLYRYKTKALYAEREVNILPSKILQSVPKEAFEAVIIDVSEQGELILQTNDEIRTYHFKQVQFVI